MSSIPAAPGPCRGQATNRHKPIRKSIGGKHGRNRQRFGDEFRSKIASFLRIIFVNPNGIGKEKHSIRTLEVKEFIQKHKVDLVGFSELNVDWRTVSYENTMWGRIQGWFDTDPALSVANNTTCPPKSYSYQPGGTAVLAMDRLSHCKESVGQDERRLGRWSWIRFKGSNNIHT